jgi:hypothetical protein
MAGAPPVVITGLVEGLLDQAVLERLVPETGAALGTVRGRHGKDHLLASLPRYNQAARLSPWVALVDLDRDTACAAAFRAKWLPAPAAQMCFRVVVQAVEAWLLADRERMASFLNVPVSKIPMRSEGEPDPKRKLVDIARRSRSKAIQESLVPGPGVRGQVGSAYVLQLTQFVRDRWRPEIAARNSDSLRRCRRRLKELVQRLS